jgi:hypothetical protein
VRPDGVVVDTPRFDRGLRIDRVPRQCIVSERVDDGVGNLDDALCSRIDQYSPLLLVNPHNAFKRELWKGKMIAEGALS